jgi:hypothetical protein
MIENTDKDTVNNNSTKDNSSASSTSDVIPPISLLAILHYAWGITMGLSSQEEQQQEANSLKDKFESLKSEDVSSELKQEANSLKDKFESLKSEDVSSEAKQEEESFKNTIDNILSRENTTAKNKAFLDEISFYLSSIERSYGFEREVYIQNITDLKNWRNQMIKYYNGLASFTETNLQGVITKILGFLLAGGTAVLTNLKFIQSGDNGTLNSNSTLSSGSSGSASEPSTAMSSNEQNLELATLNNETDLHNRITEFNQTLHDRITEFNQKLPDMTSGTSGSEGSMDLVIMIFVFLVAGALGLAAVFIFSKWYCSKQIVKIDTQNSENLQNFWKKFMKPRLLNRYINFAKDLKSMAKRYGIKDNSLPEDEESLRKIINENILPSDETYHFKIAT